MLIPALWLIVGVLSSTAWNLSLRRIMKGEEDGAAASVVSNAAATFAILPFILFLGSGFSFEAKLLHFIKSDVKTDLVVSDARRRLYGNF